MKAPIVRRGVRGNPNWCQPENMHFKPAGPTEFEQVTEGLAPSLWARSDTVKRWCRKHRNTHYIPEWLLAEFHITVNADWS